MAESSAKGLTRREFSVRLNPRHQDMVRAKIQASLIIRRLMDYGMGKISLEPAQVTALLGLLKKCVPDLAAVEHSGEVKHDYVSQPVRREWRQSDALDSASGAAVPSDPPRLDS